MDYYWTYNVELTTNQDKLCNLISTLIVADMTENSPNIPFYKNDGKNKDFWLHEWKAHGMCFKFPTNATKFFLFGLDIFQRFNFLSILETEQVRPDNGSYNRSKLATAVTNALGGVKPEIACNENNDGNVQLHEIRVCYDDQDILRPCYRGFYGCPDDKLVQFVSA
ncbi:extracellular ribonuclease LE-like [Tripterygium wilfordii]|uniref:extracellular ribonuclease LE-like n=1 Tax=Tripterygium wilfordii TaxID=458696 RepID=UPI0018F80287|nr:extracellular ribonuclease LE-like [Tripterygium wilfordii]